MRKDIDELLSEMPVEDSERLRRAPYVSFLEQVDHDLPADEAIIEIAQASRLRRTTYGVLVVTFQRVVFFGTTGITVVPFSTVAQVLPVAGVKKRRFRMPEHARVHLNRQDQENEWWFIDADPEWGTAFAYGVRHVFEQNQLLGN